MNILLSERINSANQYIELLADAYRKRGHTVTFDVQNVLYSNALPEVLHLQWPEAMYKWRHPLEKNRETLELIESRLNWYGRNGVPIVYTVHNLLPHSHVTDFDRAAYRAVVSAADVFVHHGPASEPLLKERYPDCKEAIHIVTPHGPYDYEEADGAETRKQYGLPQDRRIVLNFGRQRKSKGPEFISGVCRRVAGRPAGPKLCLFTIGPSPTDSNVQKVVRRVNRVIQPRFPAVCRRVDHFRDVDHREIPGIMAASDLLFLGHTKGLNSGLLVLAISYGKPVLYPDLGNFRDQADGWEWARPYKPADPGSAAAEMKTLLEQMDGSRTAGARYPNGEWLARNSWEKGVDAIAEAVERWRKHP
ncbi:MAG: hypothetical protein WD317_09300 [Balneolaceae bacterium]